MSIYDINVKTIDGKETTLEEYKGKVLLIVNLASKCGFTPQYEGLQKLYSSLGSKGFEILGFPSNQFREEPGTNEEIKSFCQLNYGVTFPLFDKVEVRGANIHPLYKYLSEKAPFQGWDLNDATQKKFHGINAERNPEFLDDGSVKWNFTKFLIDKEGKVVKRFDSWITPEEIEDDIKALL
ncbi:MAG: glutathione peroxidase [Eubacteriaceae bacterium]|nr:glutathione peroxidase [Eubacteriaceae bacterium]